MQTSISFLKRAVASALICAFVANPVLAQISNSACTPSGYVLPFFNGVWNDPTIAQAGMEEMSLLAGDTFNGEVVEAELFYNTSGIMAGRPDVTRLEDVAEVFGQRSTELDGILARRWEYFWELLSGGPTPLWDRLVSTVPAAGAVRTALVDSIRGRTVAALLAFRSSPPTITDYARHNARIQALVTERKKLLLVAHSQGNLFLNSAYSKAVSLSSSSSVKAVHIAPASTTLNGEYTLADIDLVIGALRAAPGSTPQSNISLPTSSSDLSGHELVKTYLDASRAARAKVRTQIVSALSALTVPATLGATGFFTVTLTWDGSGDVDLHTFEPSGAHVYYENPTGAVGLLDTDNTIANGPEHYYASCNPTVLQSGTYRIGINNYARATGRTATVQVAAAAQGELGTKTLGVGPERGTAGDSSPITVFTVTVTRTGTSTFAVSAQ